MSDPDDNRKKIATGRIVHLDRRRRRSGSYLVVQRR